MLAAAGLVLFASGLSLLARLYSLPSSLELALGANTLGVALLLSGVVGLCRALLPSKEQGSVREPRLTRGSA